MKVLLSIGIAIGVGAAAAGCGEDSKPSSVSVKGTEYAFVMPDKVDGGVVKMDFQNAGGEIHEFALGRLEGGHTAADFLKVLRSGKEPPRWSKDVAGVPAMTPGAKLSITRKLDPGRYAFICFVPSPKGKPHYELGMVKQFEIEGDSGNELPDTDGTIAAKEKSFEISDLKAGGRTIELKNDATGPREFNLVTLKSGKTRKDTDRWFKAGARGPAPVILDGAMQSIPPGNSVFLGLDLEANQKYFVSDEENHMQASFIPSG
jgi:uncharacterized cupredoxin-like copper-binding protein